MAVVVRRYALVGPSSANLLTLASPTAVVNATYSHAVIDVAIDNSVAGILTALDELMASEGYAFISNSTPAWIAPDLSGAPTAPAAGLGMFNSLRAGRRMLSQVNAQGFSYAHQPSLFQRKVALWTAQGNGTTIAVVGFGNSTTGTVTTRNVATTSLAASLRAVALVTANATTSSAGTRHNAAQFWRGNAAGLGGFFYVVRFYVDTIGANMRWFVGLLGSTAVIAANVDPGTLTDVVGFGMNAGGANVNWINNDSAGAATMTDLGASFPANVAGAVYEARIYCPPNGGTISYSLERLDVAQLVEGSVSVDIPAVATLLSPQVWVNNGAVTGQVALGLSTQYIETHN